MRELKLRLSEYLDRAERGEILRVSDRGRPKALTGPLPGRARIGQGIEEGRITPGSAASLRDVRRWTARERAIDVLAEDRAHEPSAHALLRRLTGRATGGAPGGAPGGAESPEDRHIHVLSCDTAADGLGHMSATAAGR